MSHGYQADIMPKPFRDWKIRQVANPYGDAKTACAAWLAHSLWGVPIILSPQKIHVYGVWRRRWQRVFVEFGREQIVIVRPPILLPAP